MPGSFAVAYCFDSKFAEYAAVSTHSLVSHSERKLRIYWCVPQSIADYTRILLARSGLEKLCDVRVLPLELDVFATWKSGFHFSTATYLRILLPEQVPESTILYLDSDTLVLSDISELSEIDLNSNVLAGVPDPGGGTSSRIPRSPDDVYVNSGVLLLNADLLRGEPFLAKCESIYRQYEEQIVWADQCILNKYGEGRKMILDEKWNKQVFPNALDRAQVEQILSDRNTAILHFVGPVKPWQEWCSPGISELWFSYAGRLSTLAITRVKAQTIDQAMSHASVLDRLEMYKEASQIKGQVIRSLLNALKKHPARDA